MEILFLAALIGLIPAMIAQNKGQSFVLWWLYGAGLFIVALPHALLMKPNGKNFRQCPYCAERIKRVATKCRYCGSEVERLAGIALSQNVPGIHEGPLVFGYTEGKISIISWVGQAIGLLIFVVGIAAVMTEKHLTIQIALICIVGFSLSYLCFRYGRKKKK